MDAAVQGPLGEVVEVAEDGEDLVVGVDEQQHGVARRDADDDGQQRVVGEHVVGPRGDLGVQLGAGFLQDLVASDEPREDGDAQGDAGHQVVQEARVAADEAQELDVQPLLRGQAQHVVVGVLGGQQLGEDGALDLVDGGSCLLYTSPSPRD